MDSQSIAEDALQSRLNISAENAAVHDPQENLECLTCSAKFKAGDSGVDSMSLYCATCNEVMAAMMANTESEDGNTIVIATYFC